jgi:hypothetical protein
MSDDGKPNVYVNPNAPDYLKRILGEVVPDANVVSSEEMQAKIEEAGAVGLIEEWHRDGREWRKLLRQAIAVMRKDDMSAHEIAHTLIATGLRFLRSADVGDAYTDPATGEPLTDC